MAARRGCAASGASNASQAQGTADARPAVQLPLDTSLFFKLVRLVNLTARPFVETLSRRHQLSLNEWRTMVVLASRPGAAAREVVDATGLDKMSVSRAIAALQRHGRIVKRPDPADARRTQLRLSAKGTALFEAIGTPAAARDAALFGGLSGARRRALEQTVDSLIGMLQATASEAPPSEAEQTGAE